MKYYVVEEERIVKPLYKSNFPFIKKTRWGEPLAKLIKQFLFRKTIHLFVDDIDSYRSLGGKFGATKVERFRVTDYPTWNGLTGLPSFFLPELNPAPIIRGGNSSDCYCVKTVDNNEDLVTLHSIILKKNDSADGLTEVRSVFCDYIKSWSVSIDKESAKRESFKAKKWFKARVRECNIRSFESAVDLIVRTLDASPKDSGIVRKSKAYDYHKFRCFAREMFKEDAREEDESVYYAYYDAYYFADDAWKAAKCLYDLQGDFPFYEVYDDALIHQLCKDLGVFAKEAQYLTSGLYDGSVDPKWAKDKIKELRSEMDEAGFPFTERGDTGYNWKQFNDKYNYIMGLKE